MSARTENKWPVQRDSDGSFTSYAWPGGYPIVHYTHDGAALCAKCCNANRELCDGDNTDWRVRHSDVMWENPDEDVCTHCYEVLECAYPPDEPESAGDRACDRYHADKDDRLTEDK